MYKVHKTNRIIIMCCMLLTLGLATFSLFNFLSNAKAEDIINPNLFDKTAVQSGKIVAYNGVVSDLQGLNLSDYFNIENSSTDVITISGAVNSTVYLFVCYYDSEYVFLERRMGLFTTGSLNDSFAVPNTAVYARFNISDADLNTCKVEHGNTATGYVSFASEAEPTPTVAPTPTPEPTPTSEPTTTAAPNDIDVILNPADMFSAGAGLIILIGIVIMIFIIKKSNQGR